MFGLTILGCLWFRAILAGLNRRLEEGEQQQQQQPDDDDAAARRQQQQQKSAVAGAVEHLASPDEALRMRKGFRYLV